MDEFGAVSGSRMPLSYKKEHMLTIQARRRGVSVLCRVESAVVNPDSWFRVLSVSGSAQVPCACHLIFSSPRREQQ